MLFRAALIISTVFSLAAPTPTAAAESPPSPGQRFTARDSLDVSGETAADAKACLAGLAWKNAPFTVSCEKSQSKRYDLLVRYASPITTGDATNDRVAMEWHIARDQHQQPRKRPAVVVVHESGSAMAVGRLFAASICKRGYHAFMLQLPHYGQRRTGNKRPDLTNVASIVRQAVADVRRARDAVAVLPFVDSSHIALQGTSLGGIVSATTAGLDHGFDSVFLLLAGGQLHDIIQHGEKDTAKIREKLRQAGVSEEQAKTLLATIEPTRIAHRIDPERTWLYSGIDDRVIPLKNATALAQSAKLSKSHHVRMNANHYSGIVYLPFVLNHICKRLEAD